MKPVFIALAALLACCVSANAANIAAFSQTSGSNTVTATTNLADTQTTLTVSDAVISIGQFLGVNPLTAFFDLTASSVDAAQPVGAAVIQHYSGSFCLSSAINCGGTDFLSGSFTDAAFGAIGGPGLVVNVNSPPDSLTLASDVLSASVLAAPNSFGLTFTNLTPTLHIIGSTIAPFAASFAGTVSASAAPVPEPATLAVLGLGLLGIAALRRRDG